MVKEWFKHDIHAAEDTAILRMRAQLGALGYGIFWFVIEHMYGNEGVVDLSDYEASAYALRVPKEDLKAFVEVAVKYGLIYPLSEGVYTNKRVAQALNERRDLSAKRTLAIQTRYKRGTSVPQVKGASDTSLNQNKKKSKNKEYKNTLMRDDNSRMLFDAFWDAYDHKIDRHRCVKLWDKLTDAERSAVIEHVPRYVASTPDVKYRRHPSTYLNQRSWENAIPTEATNATRTVSPTTSSSRHIPEDELIRLDLDRRKRFGLDTGQVHSTGGPEQTNGQTPMGIGPAQ